MLSFVYLDAKNKLYVGLISHYIKVNTNKSKNEALTVCWFFISLVLYWALCTESNRNII